MKKIIPFAFLFSTCFLFAQSKSILTLSEVMFYPESGNSEFIEIYNLSTSESIDLAGFKIKYYSSSPDVIASAGFGTVLPPNSFAVVLEGDYDFENGTYKNIIPPSALVLKISDNAFGSSGMANTTSRQIALLSSGNDTLEVYNYSANNRTGFSDEKILLTNNNSTSNWDNSKVPNGTPGYINSVSPLSFDLELSSIKILPENPKLNANINISATVKNKGTTTANSFSVEIYNDLNLDSLHSSSEILSSQYFQDLKFSDSVSTATNLIVDHSGTYQILVQIIFNSDEDTTNNFLVQKFVITGEQVHFNDVVINEIMYAPLPDEPEWIELFNKSNSVINLSGWKIGDNSKSSSTIKSNALIMPLSYLVISKDSSIDGIFNIKVPFVVSNFPSLNNTGDAVVLKDSSGNVVDSVEYTPDWGGNNGSSIERISVDAQSTSASNWKITENKNKATPGYINSVSQKDYDIELADIIFNSSQPMINDNVSISAKVINKGKYSPHFSLHLFEDINQDSLPDVHLADLEYLSVNPLDSSSFYFNYSIEKISTPHSYFVIAQMENDQDTSNNYFYKIIFPGYPSGTILINEVMYAPNDNEPEWIELINASNDPVNLKNWSASDLLTTPTKNKITENDLVLSPGEYLVIAKDSSLINYFPELKSKIVVVNFGTLGNTEDGVVITDFRDLTIDSLHYNSSWGGSNGHSLERLSLSSPTNDSTNWAATLAENKGTPGEINSVLNASSYKRSDLAINEIMFDPGEDNSEFIEFLNLGSKEINIGGWKVLTGEDNKYQLSETNKYIPSGSLFILAADSSTIIKYGLQSFPYKAILNSSDLNLSNDNDTIILTDMKNNTIDSVHYYSSWQNKNFTSTKNISLEKINPRLDGNQSTNWSSSASSAGATPGKQNSIYAVNQNSTSSISVSPNPFSPDNDGFEDFAIINYSLSQPVAQIRIKVFDSHGRLVRTLSNNQASGQKGSVIFNGLDDGGRALRIGIYIIFLEAVNSFNSVVENLKTAVVIARKFN